MAHEHSYNGETWGDGAGCFHVAGYPHGKPPCIFQSFPEEPEAVGVAKRLAANLDDYTQVTVETTRSGGKTGRNGSEWNAPDSRVLHRFDGLAAAKADESVPLPREIPGFPWLNRNANKEVPMIQTEPVKLCKHNLTPAECADCKAGVQTLKERHQMRQAAQPATPVAPTSDNGHATTWEQMNKREQARAVESLVKEMPAALSPAVIAVAAQRGWEVNQAMVGNARRRLGLGLGKGSRGKQEPDQPAKPETEPSRKPRAAKAQASVPARAADGDDDSPILTVQDLIAFKTAVAQIGGAAVARQVLEVLAG